MILLLTTLVIDTNILIHASASLNDFKPEAAEFLWKIYTICHCIAVDQEGKIVSKEYKKYMKNNPTLIRWWKFMNRKKKIKFRSGQGIKVDDLKELDNCFANVAIRSPDKILITNDERDFNNEVKRELERRGVQVFSLEEAHNRFCKRS